MPHTADRPLLVESERWNMSGNWSGFHSVVQAFQLCRDPFFYSAIMIDMIKALDIYLRRKVIKDPRPAYIDDAVAHTLEAFRNADHPALYMPQAPQHVEMQAISPPQQHQQMELDAVLHTRGSSPKAATSPPEVRHTQIYI